MKTSFKTAKIAASVALALGAATLSVPTQAVNLSENGLGQVGIIPFYSANGFDTYLSIVNTSSVDAIVVKIRFRESDNSRDARDFNILLSPNDVWTGTVTMGADGETPVIQTNDTSCTAGELLTASQDPNVSEGVRGISFTADDYNGGTDLGRDAAADEDVTIARTYDGHIEIIEMGAKNPDQPVRDNKRTIVGYGTHDSGYFDCSVVHSALLHPFTTEIDLGGTAGNEQTAFEEFEAPENVMKVAANLISVTTGVAAMIPVTTLQNFYVPDVDVAQNIVRDPGDDNPNLNDAYPPVSALQIPFNNPIGVDGLVSTFYRGVDAVSSLIMAEHVLNEYAIGGSAEVLNDWVITFPTKNYYVDWSLINLELWEDYLVDKGITNPTRADYVDFQNNVPADPAGDPAALAKQYLQSANAIAPFTEWFQDVSKVSEEAANDGNDYPVYGYAPGDGKSCETIVYNYYDREEASVEGEDGFSPTPSGTTNAICEEVQVLQFGAEPALNGTNTYGVVLADGFTNGWMRLTFTGIDNELQAVDSFVANAGVGGAAVFEGLPVLSFGVKSYTNGVSDERGILNYGVTQDAAYERNIDPNPNPNP